MGKIPLTLLSRLDLRHRLYGYIGLKDYTLYPLIKPGSFVQIDPEIKKLKPNIARTEFDRPIYSSTFEASMRMDGAKPLVTSS